MSGVLGTPTGMMVLELAVKGTLVLAATAVCAMMFRRGSAAERHLVWLLGIASLLVLPLVSGLVPRWELRVLPAPHPSSESVPPLAYMMGAGVPVAFPSVPAPDPPPPPAPADLVARLDGMLRALESPPAEPEPVLNVDALKERIASLPWAGIIAAAWALGALALVARLGSGWLALSRLTNRSTPVIAREWLNALALTADRLGIRRSVRLLVSEETDVPLTYGVFTPIVVLPAECEEWSAMRTSSVLHHELAHVARWDWLTQQIAQIAVALHWLNPLSWIAMRAMLIERERACDDTVLAAGAAPSAYASDLLDIARRAPVVERHAAALAMARRSQIETRLVAILDDAQPRRPAARRGIAAASGLALALIIPLAAIHPAVMPSPAARDLATRVAELSELNAKLLAQRDDVFGKHATTIAELSKVLEQLSRPAETQVAIEPSAPEEPEVVEPPEVEGPSEASPAREPWSQAASMILNEVSKTVGARAGAFAALAAACRPDGRHFTSESHTDDDGRNDRHVSWSGDGCTVEFSSRGKIEYTADFSDIRSISPGGFVELSRRQDATLEHLKIRPSDGGLQRTWSVNGQRRDYDAAAREWLREVLIELDRVTGFAVEARLPALLASGGVDAVLTEVQRMSGGYAAGKYLTRLMATTTLRDNDVRRVLQLAGAQIDADYELSRVLDEAIKQYGVTAASHVEIMKALATIEADYEKSKVLLLLVDKTPLAASPELARSYLDALGDIDADYEVSKVLLAMAKRQLLDAAVAPRFLEIVKGIDADYEVSNVLLALLDQARLDERTLFALLAAAQSIGADYELSKVLIKVAGSYTLTDAQREAYLKAADTIDAEYEAGKVLAALRRRPGG